MGVIKEREVAIIDVPNPFIQMVALDEKNKQVIIRIQDPGDASRYASENSVGGILNIHEGQQKRQQTTTGTVPKCNIWDYGG